MSAKVLMLAGDFSEDYEVMVPYQILMAVGVQVNVVCPGRRAGEYIKTAIHDTEGDQTYTEKPGHLFRLTASFQDAQWHDYQGLFLTGGRAPEYLRLDTCVIALVKHFMQEDKPVAAICHGVQILTAADVVRGRTLTAHSTVKPEILLAGGRFADVADDQSCVDGNLITAPAWPANAAITRDLISLLGIRISQ